MPISHPHRTIFIHIPKTAGTSVEAVLGMHGDKQDVGIVPYFHQTIDREHLYGRDLQHMTAVRLKEMLKNDEIFNSYFKFTIVRNPWERLVSTWAWSDQKWAKGRELDGAQFEQAVRQMYVTFRQAQTSGQLFVQSPHLNPQFLFIVDDQLRPMVDYIARYETLEDDWRRICERLALDCTLPVRMRSHHRPYREYYNEETRRMVAEMYTADVSLLGYAF